jgi:PTS system cellobiose-specific IIB component
MKILLVCSAGMSTSLMVNKMKKVAEDNKLEAEILAVAEANAQPHFDSIDILLLGPQVKYLEDKMRTAAAGRFPVMTINTQKYGMMDGLGVLKDTLRAIKEFRNK